MKPLRHFLGFLGILTLGIGLRFWHLDFKALWMDEVITALFSLGRNYQDIPLNTLFSLNDLEQIFTLKPATCPDIARSLLQQSTHPPLFFCLMHQWLQLLSLDSVHSLAWKLRTLPALMGTVTIVILYYLNRKAFSPMAGLTGAAIMAVSPFAVYLSQEARHYSLPMLLVALSLIGFLQMQQDFRSKHGYRPLLCFSWTTLNCIGFYVHYFFILAFIAQAIYLIKNYAETSFSFNLIIDRKTLRHFFSKISIEFRNNELNFFNPSSKSLSFLAFCLLPATGLIPGILFLLDYSRQSETDWLQLTNPLAPLYQLFAGWMIAVIALPVEKQPLWIQIPTTGCMILFTLWLGRYLWFQIPQLWGWVETQNATKLLLSFILIVLCEFFLLVYFFGKDITLAPRYNYVYFPAFCALLGAILALEKQKIIFSKILLVGFLSSIFVTSNFSFQKPFHPEKVALDIEQHVHDPTIIAMGYNDFQDIALGLSFALEVRQRTLQKNPNISLAFLGRNTDKNLASVAGYQLVWQKLSQLPKFPSKSLNLWMVAPGLKKQDYPPQLLYSQDLVECQVDPTYYGNVGVPYQLYHCHSIPS